MNFEEINFQLNNEIRKKVKFLKWAGTLLVIRKNKVMANKYVDTLNNFAPNGV